MRGRRKFEFDRGKESYTDQEKYKFLLFSGEMSESDFREVSREKMRFLRTLTVSRSRSRSRSTPGDTKHGQ